MLGNDKYGDCNAVTWANQRRLVSASLGTKENYPDEAQVIKFYKTQNPNFDPKGSKETNGPGSKADGGMYLQQGLNHLRKNGGPDGCKPIAFAKVDVANIEEIHEAISIFGSLWIGLEVFANIFGEFRRRQPFTIPSNPTERPIGGHAVLIGGYIPNMKCVTWGDVNEFDNTYWTSRRVNEAWVVIWPEHVGTRSFMLGVNLGQLVQEMKDLTGADITLPSAPFSNLYFVKTRQVASGYTEVHVANSDNSYALVSGHFVTGFGPTEGENGVFNVDGGELYFIRTRNTGSGRVELHRATASSNYHNIDLHAATAFGQADGDNGVWAVEGADLFFIKTKNAESGHVEVHRVAHADYSTFASHDATAIPLSDVANGSFLIYGGNLFFVKLRNTTSGKIEVHRLGAGNRYNAVTITITWFDVADADNGTWEVGTNADLYFVKTRNTGSGRAEIHIATAKSKYKEVSHYASWIGEADGPNGTWCIP